jgi:hypothetical protein
VIDSDLRERLVQLAEELPPSVVSRDLASSAWAAGRRRRVRRRVLSTALGLVVLAAIAGTVVGVTSLGVGVPQPATGNSAAAVSGYPERVTHQWWTSSLPQRPGPVAGLLQRPDGGWDVIAENGHLWRSPLPHEFGDQYPTLSPNGRFLGYLGGVNGPYLIRDLLTGTDRRIRGVGCGCSSGSLTDTTRLWMEGQAPAFWSPDSKMLVFRGGDTARMRGGHSAILIGHTGVAHAPAVPSSWFPAGWTKGDQIIWTDQGRHTRHGRVVGVHTTSIAGRVLATVRVRLPTPAQSVFPSQWTWTASPDGHQLLFNSGTLNPGSGYLATYSLANGALLTVHRLANTADSCPNAWAGTTPTSPVLTPPSYATTTTTASAHPHPLSVTDPSIGAQCVIWASDALNGTPHGGLFGTSTAAWTWWWREATAAIATLLALTVLALWTKRRRVEATPPVHDVP